MDEQEFLVELTDDEGVTEKFRHILMFDMRDAVYVALEPEKSLVNEEEGEVVLLRVEGDGEDKEYVSIDDDLELEEAFSFFLDLYDQEEQ